MPVTMSGAIVTIAQIDAASAAATENTTTDTGWTSTSWVGGGERAVTLPETSRSRSVRYGGMNSPMGTVERRLVRLTPAAALTIVGTIVGLIVARRVFVAAHRPLSWAAAAVVAAVLLDPVVDRLAVHIRRVPAVLLTFAGLAVLGVGTDLPRLRRGGAGPRPARDGGARRRRDDRGPHRPRRRARARLRAHRPHPRRRRARSTTGSRAATTCSARPQAPRPSYFVCAILTVFLMTYGPRMANAALLQERDLVRRARIAAIVGPAVRGARAAIVFAIAEALWVGLAVGGALDPARPARADRASAVTAGILSLFPYVGLTVGCHPDAPAHPRLPVPVRGDRAPGRRRSSLQLIDSMVVRPRMAERSIEIGLAVPWVVALLGYAVYGIGGAAYGVAFALFGLAVLERLEAANRAAVGSA